MTATAIRKEEALGLGLAIAAHAALVAVLVLRPVPASVLPPPDKMTVTLSDEVGLTATSPQPAAAATPDEAPPLGEPPAPAAEAEAEPVRPQPAPPQPAPPKPVIKASPPPRAQPVPRPTARPNPDVIGRLARQPAPRAAAGGSRIGDDFLRGVPGARASGTAQTAPAAAIGPAVRSALAGAISRQLKPRWAAPQGVDADKLVTLLTWNLNRDGTLAGTPRVVRQDGINDANRAQAARHAEQAIRAVQLAAPFTLPPEYYDAWKRVAEFRFDRRLAQ